MKKSLSQIGWSALVIAPALLLFTAVSDLPHVAVIVAVGYLFSALQRKPLVWNDRSIIYTLVIVAVTVVLADLVFPFNSDRFGYITMIIQPQFYTVGAFYLAVALTFFNTGRAMVGGAAAAAVFSLIASADVFNLSVENVRLPLVDDLINKHFYRLYVWVMLIELGAVLAAFRKGVPRRRTDGRSTAGRKMVLAMLWATLALAIYGGFKTYRHFESEFRRWENMLIRMSSRQNWLRRNQTVVFGKETNLYRVMSPEVQADRDRILLRSVGPVAPGYMRGRVYDEYLNGIWKESADKQSAAVPMPEKNYEGLLTFKSFFIGGEQPDYPYRYQIYQDRNFISDVLQVPGPIRRLDAIASHGTLSESGVIVLEEWQRDGGYTVFADKGEIAAYPAPVSGLPPYYLQVSPFLRRELNDVLDAVPGLREAHTDAERFTALLAWFGANFQYDLEWRSEPGPDPLIHFLLTVRKGHCELYAASMAILLRMSGVPTRYITGFICEEPHPSGNYYVARVGNAHAWLEAFDRDRRQWVMLEPTPPGEIGGEPGEWNFFSDWRDRVGQGWRELLANLRRGHFADAIAGAFDFIWAIIRLVLLNPVGLPAAVAVVAGWYLYRRRKRRRETVSRRLPTREAIALGKLYRRRAARWEKRLRLPPAPARTSSELLQQLRDSGVLNSDELQGAEEFIRQYQRLRFGHGRPSREELRALERL
jgi:transglutaminase-like putative cysteine protease